VGRALFLFRTLNESTGRAVLRVVKPHTGCGAAVYHSEPLSANRGKCKVFSPAENFAFSSFEFYTMGCILLSYVK
jgi:hypothetical protein